MDIKENLIHALTGKEIEKTPVTAFPPVLTTELALNENTNLKEVNYDSEKMAKVAGSLYDYTRIEGITIPFNLRFETESILSPIEIEERLYDTTMKSPFNSLEDIEIPSDFTSRGQFPTINKAYSLLNENYNNIPIIGEVTGAFTLLTDLIDLGKIIKMLKSNRVEIDDTLDEINKNLIEEIKFYQEIGVDCIVVNDPSSTTKIIQPNLFTELIQPHLIELSDNMDVPGVLHICGDTNPNLENMLSCGYEGLSISQEVDINYAKEIKEKIGSKTVICGNLDVGETLLMKNMDEVKDESKKCLDKKVDILGPGCSIAPETSTYNIKSIVEARNEYFDKDVNF